MSSDGEDTAERKNERMKISERTSTEFDMAIDGKLTPLLSTKKQPTQRQLGSDEETTERNYLRSSSSGGEMQLDIENELSKSLQALMSPSLQQILLNVSSLKTTLKKQVK